MTEHVFTLTSGGNWTTNGQPLGPNGSNSAFSGDLVSDHRAIATDFNELNSGTKDFSIEFWGYFVSDFPYAISIGDAVNTIIYLRFLTSVNKLEFVVSTPGDAGTLSSVVSTSAWHHIVCTWKDSTHEKKIYIDGVLDTTDSTTFTGSRGNTGTYNTNINSNFANGALGVCFLDEHRIYQTVLTSTEVSNHFANDYTHDAAPSTLVLYLPWSEGSGTSATTDTAGEIARDTPVAGSATGAVSFLPRTASGNNGDAIGAVSTRARTANGYDVNNVIWPVRAAYGLTYAGLAVAQPRTSTGVSSQQTSGTATLEARTATGLNVVGTDGIGNCVLERRTCTLPVAGNEHSSSYDGIGAVTAEPRSGSGEYPDAGNVVLKPRTASGISAGQVVGVCIRQPYAIMAQAAAVIRNAYTAYGVGSAEIPETYDVFAMNTRTHGITEYQNQKYNSYALIGDSYFGVDPSGLNEIMDESLNYDSLTAVAAIDWRVRTGQMDDKKPGLKRLPEVLLGLRTDGTIRVKVWSNDNTFNEYILPASMVDKIHQHRVKCGKGVRSRWYMVELLPGTLGTLKTALELDSMQVNMTETTRRLG